MLNINIYLAIHRLGEDLAGPADLAADEYLGYGCGFGGLPLFVVGVLRVNTI